MPEGLHTHAFKGVTVYVEGHIHLFSGVSTASPNTPGHTHIMAGRTGVNEGHSHGFSVLSEGPTRVDHGHYHYFNGNTWPAMNHSHGMSSTTFEYP